jgi:hypothetical protein
MNRPLLKLVILAERLAVCRLDAGAPIPDWAGGESFLSITRTRDELSVICEEHFVPSGVMRAVAGGDSRLSVRSISISSAFWFLLPSRWRNRI